MRRITFFVVSFVAGAFAFTNLKFTPDTITMGEQTVATGNFSTVGDSADVVLFVDDNANGVIDAGEIVIYDSKKKNEKFIDGGDENDTVADGLAYIEMKSGWEDGALPFPGNFVLILDDTGGPDTAGVVVKPGAGTNTSIAGTVSGPSGTLANVLVWVEVDIGDDEEFEKITRSTADGTYLMYLPDSLQGKECWIGSEDEFKVLAGQSLIPPEPVETTVVASITGLNFVYEQATQFIKGLVVNETGAAVGNVKLWFESEDDKNFEVEVDANGNFFAPVVTGTWKIWFGDWSSDKSYMTPEIKITVGATDDTVSLVYMLYTTNATISGKIFDSAGVNLNDDFGINVAVDTTGQWEWDKGVWYYADADINDDGTFSVKVHSKFLRYMLNTWAEDLPQGYFISPSSIDSVGPGQSGIQIFIKEADRLMEVTVVDMVGTGEPVPNVSVQIQEANSSSVMEMLTDTNGVVRFNVYPGYWQLWLKEINYMKQDLNVEVKEEDDTLKITFNVLSTDATITGTVSGDITAIIDDIEAVAYGKDSLGINYRNAINLDQDGKFILNVTSRIPGYYIGLNDWDIPDDYVVVPGGDYTNVAAGTSGLTFTVKEAKGSISGKLFMTFPTGFQAGVKIIDSSTMWTSVSEMKDDSTYHIQVPNGTYTVIGGYESPTDTLYHIVHNVVVLDNDVVVNFYDTGGVIVPIIHTPVTNNLVFAMRCYPNPFRGIGNIAFTTPVDGKATLRIFDLNGRMLKTLYNGAVYKGKYTVQFTTGEFDYQLGAGYYVARIDIKGKKRYTKNLRIVNIK